VHLDNFGIERELAERFSPEHVARSPPERTVPDVWSLGLERLFPGRRNPERTEI
jgi:hypothetical protein